LLPEPGNTAAVICLGGPQSAYDDTDHPFLIDEEKFLQRAVREHVPVLAICLGSQILAKALGGRAIPGIQGLECGFINILPSPEYMGTEPAGQASSSPSLELHPRQAELLALRTNTPGPHRVRTGYRFIRKSPQRIGDYFPS
jgi:GMP synthase (glutamine-hydrolysing)